MTYNKVDALFVHWGTFMICKIQMVNCQSWKNGTITLASDRLNAIIADNGTGKSVLFKMLKITANPKFYSSEDRKNLIRHNADSADIYFEFNDGGIACTKVFPTYVMYMYKPADEKNVRMSYEPDAGMLKQAGILTDGETPFVANIVDTDQDLLLVNSQLKYNYNLFKMLAESPELETVRARITDGVSHLAGPIGSVSRRCDTLKRKIDELTYFDVRTRELELEHLEKAKDLMFKAIDIALSAQCFTLIPDVIVDCDTVQNAIDIMDMLSDINIDSIAILPKPVNVTAELELLEMLNSLDLPALSPAVEFTDMQNELFMLEKLQLLQNAKQELCLSNPPACIDYELNLLDALENLVVQFKECWSYTASTNEAVDALEDIESQLKESGMVVDCEIYGKVVYNGKECVPCSH